MKKIKKQVKKLRRKMLPGLLAVLLIVQIFLPAQIFLDPPRIEIQEAKAANWYNASWNYRVKLTIQASMVDTDMTDYPIYVDLGNLPAGFHTNVNQTDARDIRVTKADGTTELAREVVVYDSTTDTGELHTKYSGTLSSTVDTDIYIYYGNAGASDYAFDVTYGRNNVWTADVDSSGSPDAKMVQHLSENPAGGEPPDGSDEVFDSTSNVNDGNTGGTMTSGDQVTGQIDGSVDFEGTDDYVDCGSHSSLDITDAITIEAWVKPSDAGGGAIFNNRYEITGADTGLFFGLFDSDNKLVCDFNNNTQTDATYQSDANAYTVGEWVFVSLTKSGTNAIFYVNGLQFGNAITVPATIVYDAGTTYRYIGNCEDGGWYNSYGVPNHYFNGTIDEVRVYNRALSVDEIATQYNNQSSPSTFYLLGIEEKQSPTALTSWSYRKEIVINHSEVDTDLTNFPVLINLGSDTDLAGDALPSGNDILFTTDSIAWSAGDENDKLAHEIEFFDGAGADVGELQAWVRVPSLSSTVNTTIYMYYGNGSATDQRNSAIVWGGNTKMVQHLQETPQGTVYDSTSNANDSDSNNADPITSGQIDGAYDFTSANSDYIDCGADNSLNITDAITIEAWVKPTAGQTGYIFAKREAGTNMAYSLIFLDTRYIRLVGGGTANVVDSTITLTLNTWNHITAIINGTTGTIYINGEQKGTGTVVALASKPTIRNTIGARWDTYPSVSIYFNGSIDEVRIYNRALAVEEISTQYNNQSSPSTFYSLGIEEKQSPISLTSWSYRKEIVINHSEVDTNLTNFPVLINLGSDTDLAGDAMASGNDILFTTDSVAWSTGTENDKLAHEIEKFTSATGELQAWVRVPSLSSSVNTTIYMYYGNGSADDQRNSAIVWDGNTKMVQHLQETPQGTVYDSTSNANDSDSNNADPITSGQIDGAYDFTSANSDYIDCGADNSLNITDAITIEAWVKPNMGSSLGIMAKGTSAEYGVKSYYFYIHGSLEKIVFFLNDKRSYGTPIITNQDWHHVVGTWSKGGTIDIFIDGNEVTYVVHNTLSDNIIESAEPLKIGWYHGLSYFNGSIDEVRIYNRALAVDEISTQYNNQSSPSTFYSLGIEEKKSPAALTSWSYRKEIVINHSEVDTDLTNFPVLINLGSDTDLAGDALSTGNDILFTTDSIAWSEGDENDKLAHEIEFFDGAGADVGELQAWVRVPSLSSSVNTTIYMYYGNGSATDQRNSAIVWDGNTKMVQHLQETPQGTVYDSTSNANDSDSNNADPTTSGQIDGAYDFNGSDDYIDCGADNSLNITDAITIEAWVKPNIVEEEFKAYISKNYLGEFDIKLDFRSGKRTLGWRHGDGTNYETAEFTNYITTEKWYHIVLTRDANYITAYKDGVYFDKKSFSMTDLGHVHSVIIGSHSPNGSYFNGSIDGVKIYNRVLAVEEITTQYNNEKNDSGDPFYALGAEQSIGITTTVTDANSGEDGATAEFTIVLDSEPSANVTVNLLTDDATEGVVTTPAGKQLTFTSANWDSSQTVLVTGQNDDVADGNIEYNVDISTTSSDTSYNSLTDAAGLINVDNDVAPSGSGGSLPQDAYSPPASTREGFSVLINNGDKHTNQETVNLKLNGGPDAKTMAISDFSDFKNAVQEPYQETKQWSLSYGDGVKTIYVKFYTKYGIGSKIVSDSIILDTIAPIVKAPNAQKIYQNNQSVIIFGTTEPSAIVAPKLNGEYFDFGIIIADKNGNWSLDLGKLAIGNFKLELKTEDQSGNLSEALVLNFEVVAFQEEYKSDEPIEFDEPIKLIEKPSEPSEPTKPVKQDEPSIIDKITDIFEPKEEEKEIEPEPEINIEDLVSKEAPLAMSGQWELLSQKSIKAFVSIPLPREIRKLTEKFPEFGATLKKVGITKVADIEKLKTVKLTLPGLTERAGPEGVGFEPTLRGKFVLPKAIPTAKLSSKMKQQIPTEIIFAKTGKELIDFNIALSVTEKGEPEQKIATIVGKPLQLVVKPEYPVKSVKGYVVFKSKKISQKQFSPLSLRGEAEAISLNSLLGSLIFANPVFAHTQEQPVRVEEKLVLLEFEYTDPDGDGIYTAEIQAPLVEGEYEIITVMEFEDPELGKKEIRLITVVDPEGYVYTQLPQGKLRITGAIVSIFYLNPETKQYELWPAKEYQQENPQITDDTGKYSFLVPHGMYYLKVEAPKYPTYQSETFQIKEGSGVHMNIELKSKYWYLNIIDWKVIILILFGVLLLYNFYRDKIRERSLKLKT